MITKIYDDSVGGGSGTQNVTRSLTIPSGRNRILIVLVTSEAQNSTQGGGYAGNTNVTGITFNGVALTKIGHGLGDNAATCARADLWYLKNPDVTTANLVVTRAGAVEGSEVSSAVLAGVNLRSPIDQFHTEGQLTGTTWNCAVTTQKSNTLLIGGVGATTGVGGASDGGQTSLVFNSNNGFTKGFAYKAVATPSAASLQWTGNDSRWGAIVASIKPFRAGGFAALL